MNAMMTNFLDLFHLYLIPFAIAVPIAIFVIYISTRNVADRQVGQKELEEQAREKLRVEEEKMLLYQQEKRRAEEAEGERRRLADEDMERRRLAELQETERRISELREAEQRLADLAEEARRNAERAVYPPPIDLSAPAVSEQVSVLVVDDSNVARIKLKKLFEANGYLVETAEDGHGALETLQKTHFSVLVTDLEMPNMDGFELIAAVQGSLETEDLPIIAITGHDEMQARVHDMKGLYGIFKKPWNDREILKRVQALSTMRSRAA